MQTSRLRPAEISPELYSAVAKVDELTYQSTLGKALIELVKVRASQINGCAFCLNMHSKAARKAGNSEQKLYLLSAWKESPIFTSRERAALGWTDALSRITEIGARDEHYTQLLAEFDEKEIVDLTLLIGLINLWNRLAIGMKYTLPNPAIDPS
ncbi:Carboxymuconolactone decarboxylase family protein [Photorhabdus australis subsp. thailandensis]|uniref:Carboxymuconolactone decarboxylase family protein n=1 Tax=Photorhabdus australis subsp. thailandensis TaxID=2805096 RepID=A0A1C0U6T3_9GAMM|nr:carboxymuconolactone decarboxylase family protein [Photorhabdus australis]OCQ53628.1 Carboxymuconolactone decarboxylase family protein [Photorhabdus australis subsp. thailandensis]